MFTQRVMSEYTIWFFVFLIVTATWAIMSLMIAAMLARFKAVSLAAERRLAQEKAQVGRYTYNLLHRARTFFAGMQNV